ncbi:MAG: serine hydrolase [Sphingomonas sp.]|nr:MAG: serine hydrolase [Sphingomonas sp.]
MAGAVSNMDRLGAGVLPVNLIEGVDQRSSIEERLAAYHCPGVAICVIEDGEIAEARGFGRIEQGGAAVAADTIFAGASISKALTAVLAMQLVEQGAVELDEPINRHLQRWQIPENDFTRRVPVTLRHLLSHRAGTTVPGFGNYPLGRPAPSLVQILSGRPPSPTPPVEVDKLPGESVRYSGGGTQIVQLLLEDVVGTPFATLAQERIFDPLGMRRSTFAVPLADVWKPLAAIGHDSQGAPLASRYSYTPQLAAGGVYTTAPDYARFLIECRNAWLGQPNALMSRDTVCQMLESQDGGQFGLGWQVDGEGAAARFYHGGSNEGYQCNAMCLPEQGCGVVIMTNAVGGIMLHAELLTTVAEVYGWKGFNTRHRVRSLSTDEQQAYVGQYDVTDGIARTTLEIWIENGQLHSFIHGLVFPPGPIYLADNGRFFSQRTRGEFVFAHDAAGIAQSLVVYAEGGVELIRAERRA